MSKNNTHHQAMLCSKDYTNDVSTNKKDTFNYPADDLLSHTKYWLYYIYLNTYLVSRLLCGVVSSSLCYLYYPDEDLYYRLKYWF